MKRVLTIAGSDSGGGAGIQADLKVITILGGFGMSVITALTAQNTVGVQGVHPVPIHFIELQMESVLCDIGADAAKTGMLANAHIVTAVADRLKRHRIANLVVDPVMVATSGDVLLDSDAIRTVADKLLPLASIVTPNLHEAALLAEDEVVDSASIKRAARRIHRRGARRVLIKGGHLEEGQAVDLLYDGERYHTFSAPRLAKRHTHGTGCTLSAAIAVFLAQGNSPVRAVGRAKELIQVAIANGVALGSGTGPTNPYAWLHRERSGPDPGGTIGTAS